VRKVSQNTNRKYFKKGKSNWNKEERVYFSEWKGEKVTPGGIYPGGSWHMIGGALHSGGGRTSIGKIGNRIQGGQGEDHCREGRGEIW